MKRIALITHNYPSKGVPVFVFVQQLVHQIVDMGYQVDVIAPQSITARVVRGAKLRPKQSTEKTEGGNSYKVYRPYYFTAGNIQNATVRKIVRWNHRQAIMSVLKGLNPDVVYGHFWSSVTPVATYCKQHNIPLFVACGEGDNALEEMVEAMSSEEIAELNSCMTGMISVSSENRRKCIRFGLISDERIVVLPNCVNTDLFAPKENPNLRKKLGVKDEDFLITFVGGFIHRKGAKRLTDAIEKIQDGSIKTIFIGAPMPPDIELPEGDSIVFKDRVEHDDIPQYLNASDLFVLPTLKEGCSNAIVEALVSALPVVSSDGPFNDDILNEKNSIRVNPMDIDQIASAIKRFKEDKEFYRSCKQNLIETRENYSIKGRAKNIVQFIENRINKNN